MSDPIQSWARLEESAGGSAPGSASSGGGGSPSGGGSWREEAAGRSLWEDAWRRLLRNRMAVVGGAVMIVVALVAISAPLLSETIIHFGPHDQDLMFGPQPPLTKSVPTAPRANGEPHTRAYVHWFGTDELGRDLFIRVCYGARVSLLVGLIATLVSLLIGVTYGAVAGYFGGKVDAIMMRLVDILFCLPFMMFVIMLMVFVGRYIYLIFLALGAVQWLTMSRVVRGQILSLKSREFVEAARATGVGEFTIVFRHLIPNSLGPIIVYATLNMPVVMLSEAFLSFLGLGVQPPDASWGSLAAEGAATMDLFPWMIVFPGLALAVTLFSLNFLGDGLRDAFDPSLKNEAP